MIAKFVLLTMLLTSGLGCKTPRGPAGDASDLDSLSANSSATNYFVMFGAPGEGSSFLKGVARDMENVPQYFGASNVGFKTAKFYNPSHANVIAQTKAYAAAVGSDGTLIWYFSGHGTADGELSIDGRKVKFREIANAIKSARGYKPLKRLIVMIDACYSGRLIYGSGAVDNFNLTDADPAPAAEGEGAAAESPELTEARTDLATRKMINDVYEAFDMDPTASVGDGGEVAAPEVTASAGLGLAGSLYEQLIVLVSSSSYQTSNDHAVFGGRFSEAMKLTINDMMTAGTDVSIKSFLDKVVARTKRLNEYYKSASPQTPDYQIEPLSVGRESFWKGSGLTSSYTGGSSSVAGLKRFPIGFTAREIASGGRNWYMVNSLVAGGLANRHNLAVNDFILTVNSSTITDEASYDAAVDRAVRSGARQLTLTISRNQRQYTINIPMTAAGATTTPTYQPATSSAGRGCLNLSELITVLECRLTRLDRKPMAYGCEALIRRSDLYGSCNG